MPGGTLLGALWDSAQAKPLRRISMARMRRWLSSFCAQPLRYIIQRKEGFIQVMRVFLYGGETKVPWARALSAIASL